MARLHLHFRVRTLLVLVALVALALGGVRWWQTRREILKMAKWHEATAVREEMMTEIMRAELRNEDEFVQGLIDGARKSQLLLDERRGALTSLGMPLEEEAKPPLVSEEQILQDESKISVAHIAEEVAKYAGVARWHRDRAKELRGKWFFNMSHERLRDWQRAEDDIQRTDATTSKRAEALAALYESYAAIEEAYIEKLARDDSPQAVAPGFDINSRIAHHRKQADEYRQKAKHERSQFDRDHTDPPTWRREQWFKDSVPFDEAARADYQRLGLLKP